MMEESKDITREPEGSDSNIAVAEESESSRLREELYRLSISSLREWLGKFGYDAAEDTQKSELVDAVLKLQQRRLDEAAKTTEAAVAEVGTENDPMVSMVFENLECPGANIEFTYQKGGFTRGDKGKVKPAPKWHFFPGRTYTVPLSVVNHLNSLKVPADRNVNATEDGMITSIYSGEKQNRFSCRVQFTDEQVNALVKGQ